MFNLQLTGVLCHLYYRYQQSKSTEGEQQMTDDDGDDDRIRHERFELKIVL